jgi:hypothetical protein
MLARRISDAEKTTIAESLTAEQRKALAAVLPLETHSMPNIEAFNELNSTEKVKTCRALLERLRASAETIQSGADLILSSLLKELVCQETDWAAIKLVMFSVHGLLFHCTFRAPDLKRALLSVAFFANRWQRKLVLLDGLPQTINSIVFKLFENLPPIQIFTTLLEGMSRFKGNVPSDSFYCKCWVALSDQLTELMQPGDAAKLIQFATEQQQEFGNDIRSKLCQALSLTASGKKPAPKPEERSKAAQPLRAHSPAKKPTVPVSSKPATEVAAPEPFPAVVSRIEAKPLPCNARPSPEQESQEAPGLQKAPLSDSEGLENRRPAETNQVAELKIRLQQLRQRWK